MGGAHQRLHQRGVREALGPLHGHLPGHDGLRQRRDRATDVHCHLHRPQARALRADHVGGRVDQKRAGLIGIRLACHLVRDVQHVAVQCPPRLPLLQHGLDGSAAQAEAAQRGVDLGPDLQDRVLAGVVVHLDAAAGTPLAAHRHTGPAVGGLRGGRLDDRLDVFPDAEGAPREEGRPLPGALCATGHAHAQEALATCLDLLGAQALILEVRVPQVHDDVLRLEDAHEVVDDVVRGLPRGDQNQRLPGLAQGLRELLVGCRADQLRGPVRGAVRGQELLRDVGLVVPHRHDESLVQEVQCQVAAHDANSNNSHTSCALLLGFDGDRIRPIRRHVRR
mmetsp:Transcript_108741/g.307568  ORF Transcript_108741/g.307568 Transcript_108741/m.307568 type:complete len:336 (+) Transcript_108741:800-1807(+)